MKEQQNLEWTAKNCWKFGWSLTPAPSATRANTTTAAALPGKDPERFVPGAFIKLGFFITDDDLPASMTHQIVLWNTGQLPERWTLEKLMGKHPSNPFNPLLASAFFRAGYVESWRRGIEKMRRECANHDVPAPIFDTSMSGLMLTFKANPVHLTAALGEKLASVLLGLTGEVTPEAKLLRAMASAALQTLPRRALQEALGLSDDEHFRKTFLLPALAGGLIEMTLPDKPTSRLQQYRLTEAGRTRLQALTTRGKVP